MKKKILLGLLVLLGLFTITGCGKELSSKEKETNNNIIKITEKDKGYVTTFNSANDTFVQKDPKYNQIHSEKLGVFISFDYIESSKETYDYYKTHNLFGNEYAEGDVKEYTWNNYSGYTYNIKEKELSFRILLVDDEQNSIVLTAYVGDEHTVKDLNMSKTFDSEEFQKFLNSIKFKKESK